MNMNMNNYIKLINDKLDEYLKIEYPQALFKSMKYTLMLPGKRLRPIMCLETCKLLGGDIEDAFPTAAAIEMLHVQTLIHDDLPCMDNDDYRRGKPSNHKIFGEAAAVLAGDAFLTYAPQVILKYSDNLTTSQKIMLLNEFFNYGGARGVIAGQIIDIECENNPDIKDKDKILEYLHLHKTSDLFQLAMRSGAIIANADDDKLSAITNFAINFGLAFQMADDILDEISTFEQLGKTVGKDKKENKLTYVSLYGLDEAKHKLSCKMDICRDIMNKQNLKSEMFNDIIEQINKKVGI